jgi:hypothetical protein
MEQENEKDDYYMDFTNDIINVVCHVNSELDDTVTEIVVETKQPFIVFHENDTVKLKCSLKLFGINTTVVPRLYQDGEPIEQIKKRVNYYTTIETDKEINSKIVKYNKFKMPKKLEIFTLNTMEKPVCAMVKPRCVVIHYEDNKPVIAGFWVVTKPNSSILTGSLTTVRKNMYIAGYSEVSRKTGNKLTLYVLLKGFDRYIKYENVED